MAHPRYPAVVVEADGGSRGNPGNAAYGAVLKDAVTGAVIAERGERIGVASNNVAEYSGLIAGLRLYAEHAEGAELEVRMDSKLVVEQMAGRWRIKHPDMRRLAIEANGLAPIGTEFTWIPRERNTHADRLANEALDAPEGAVIGGVRAMDASAEDLPITEAENPPLKPPRAPWEQPPPTTLILVRHGDTDHTAARTFSGSDGTDPGLNLRGRDQVKATAEWLAPLAGEPVVLLSSPMRRTRESAGIIAQQVGTSYTLDEGFVEASFGSWEGLTYRELLEKDPEGFAAWFASRDYQPGDTGDSMTMVAERMAATRDRILGAHPGTTIVAVTHLTPIKMLLQDVLAMPFESMFKNEVSPASVTIISWYADGRGAVRLLNALPSVRSYVGTTDVR